MQEHPNDIYPGFGHEAPDLLKFKQAADIFTILLANGAIVHFISEDTTGFGRWLKQHGIRDIGLEMKL